MNKERFNGIGTLKSFSYPGAERLQESPASKVLWFACAVISLASYEVVTNNNLKPLVKLC